MGVVSLIVTTHSKPRADRLIRKIALLGSHLPRQCGIATFGSDLANALSATSPGITVDAIAVSDFNGYEYPPFVTHEILESDKSAYAAAAEILNNSGYEILSIQHEYGIYGGSAGAYLMDLARAVKMPIVTTLHTVLGNPSLEQRSVLDELLQLSERIVVMSERAISILADVHSVCPSKIDLIPHGIPEIPSDRSEFRKSLNISGPMILTFGLLSPDKGVEYVIEAMPEIVKNHPGATYVLVGATHPHIRASVGEVYRNHLKALAVRLGVENNVRFVDWFVVFVNFLGLGCLVSGNKIFHIQN